VPGPPGGSAPGEGRLPSLAHLFRDLSVLAVEGPDRAAFLQGQLTQEVLDLRSGMSRLAAGLTSQGKLLYFGRLVALDDALLLVVESLSAESARAHLARYAAFQKVTVRDATPEWTVVSLYGPEGARVEPPPDARRLPPWGELSSEMLAPADRGMPSPKLSAADDRFLFRRRTPKSCAWKRAGRASGGMRRPASFRRRRVSPTRSPGTRGATSARKSSHESGPTAV
jgi:hypothetical protein